MNIYIYTYMYISATSLCVSLSLPLPHPPSEPYKTMPKTTPNLQVIYVPLSSPWESRPGPTLQFASTVKPWERFTWHPS